ncbi:MAG TPA: hypothetical protein VND99_05615, partial [Candidatus Acidoferrales bacterium]|nr:hypothetical protein [Candidatus Acidoferrales bacterium]
ETVDGKKQFADQLLPVIASIKNEIIKEHYIKKISTELDTSYESIVRELDKLRQPRVAHVQQEDPVKQKRTKEELLEEYLLALIVQNEAPKKALDTMMNILSEVMPKERAYHKVMDHLLSHFEHHADFNSDLFGNNLPKELVPTYDTCFLVTLPNFLDEEHAIEEVRKTAQQLKRIYIQKRLKALSLQMKQKEEAGQEDEVEALRKTYTALATHIE